MKRTAPYSSGKKAGFRARTGSLSTKVARSCGRSDQTRPSCDIYIYIYLDNEVHCNDT